MTSRKPASVMFGQSPNEAGWKAAIHMVVKRIGRHYGFQAFNSIEQGRTKTYTPATIFLVTDHLHHLLVGNYMRRDKTTASDEDKFVRAVFRLHAGIFQAYKDWCTHVELLERLPQLEYKSLVKQRGETVLEWEYRLEELVLYFLVYSESANVRHCPELIWFLFWILRNSTKRATAVMGISANDPSSAFQAVYSEEHRGIIRKQEHLRNKYDQQIEALRREYNIKANGDLFEDDEIADLRKRVGKQVRVLMPNGIEADLITDMVVYGDSGAFVDKIIEPVFNYFAREVLDKKTRGKDIQARVAYDDCNDSVCSKDRVISILSDLGCKINRRKRTIVSRADPYSVLLAIGSEGQKMENMATNTVTWETTSWNFQNAMAWWSNKVFGKTFMERRSWLSMGRAFFRVWMLLIMEFQTLCVCLWGWDNEKYRWYWVSTLVGTHALGNLCYEIAGAWTQRGTREVRLHGNPFWRHHAWGVLEWLVILALLALCFTAQWVNFFPNTPNIWWYAAGVYTGIAVLQAVLSQRDGYCVSLTNSVAAAFRMCHLYPLAWLFDFIGRSSARGPAEQHLAPYQLRVGWGTYLSNAVFWITVIACKVVFDWYAVMYTMKDSVIALFNYGSWLGYDETTGQDTGFDLDIILCIGRVIPGFIVVMNDMQIFYYIVGACVGGLKGLLQLNLGSISSFQELVLTFHKAPQYWGKRCLSNQGKINIHDHVRRVMKDPSSGGVGPGRRDGEATRGGLGDAGLVSDHVFDATASILSTSGRRETGSGFSRLHLDDNDLPLWLTFADVWNSSIAELRDLDLISNKEEGNLRFVNIFLDDSTIYVPGMRPIMLPVFFYGGQVVRALESPGDDPSQGVVLSEIRSLLVYFLAEMRIVSREHVKVLCEFVPEKKASKLDHKQMRNKSIAQVSELCTCIKDIMSPGLSTFAHGEKFKDLRKVLQGLLAVARHEAQLVLAKPSRKDHGKAKAMLDVLNEVENTCLDSMCWAQFWGEVGSLDFLYPESQDREVARTNVGKVADHLYKMLNTSAKGAQPRGEEAIRLLSFFMGSLKNPTLMSPPSLDEMLSWTVLTPHYKEDVYYALNKKEVAGYFGMKGADVSDISDLMNPNDDGVTVMAWLRSNYSLDWDNLMERLSPHLKKANIEPASVRESDFDEGAPLAHCRMDLIQWASYRGQHLSRTVRGMMAYEKALRLLAKMENPNPGISPLRYIAGIDELVRSKFSYVVASQNYGASRKARNPKDKWLARGVEMLLHQHPGLRVAFLDSQKTASAEVQFSVLAKANRERPFEDPQCVSEIYRIRLPVNRLPDPDNARLGVILGEGKPENQNASIIFCFGEAIQAIDMNQDNYLFEALKMRNLIDEFNPPRYNDDTWKSALGPYASRRAGPDAVAIRTKAEMKTVIEVGHAPDLRTAEPQSVIREVTAYERPWPDMRNMPVALIGFREWIFSSDSGALASFAAATEFTFGSMVQRIMTWPGAVRFHYGHPDLWNKLFVMTRGGVSKATKGFHISEDVFAGYNHTIRGGKVKFKEFISVGKGRDMGFDSINSFESKVSGGNGEQVMSRDVFRLGTQFDFFRLLGFYHSGPGFFINSYLVLLSVYANMWMLTLLALTNNQELQDPNDPTQVISTLTGQPTSIAVQQLVQIGMFSIVTYAIELLLEYGLIHMLATLILQIIQGSIAFFVFRTRTTAKFFLKDVQYGGAAYIATGRGYQLHHNSFVHVYSQYSRSHLYYAAELLLLLILLPLLGWSQYAATTWSTWLVSVSLFWAPFWFNPSSFRLENTDDDFKAWLLWMRDVVDVETKKTWAEWNKDELAKPRNDNSQQSNKLATVVRGILGALPTAVLTLGSITGLENTEWNKWAIFGVITGVFWGVVLVLGLTQRLLVTRTHYRIWRLIRTITVVCLIAFFICAIIFVPTIGGGVGLRNFILIVFANFSTAAVITQVCMYAFPSNLLSRTLVDKSYRVLDYILGFFLFFWLFLFSFLQVFDWVQTTLLYNIKFKQKLEQARILGGNNYISSYIDRSLERNNNNLRTEIRREFRRDSRAAGSMA